MQRLNAIDAISPAFTRTHDLLFRPFRLGRSWKLAASSYVGFAGAIFVPVPLFFLLIPFLPGTDQLGRTFALAIGTVYTAIFFVIFYLGARMSLVDFEMIATRQKFIAPMWRHYGRRVWPWIGLKVAVGTVLSAAMTPFLINSGKQLFGLILAMPKVTPGQPPNPMLFQSFFNQIISVELHFVVVYLVLKFASTLLDDFVKPFFLLEDIPLAAAISRGFAVFLADPIGCILYLLLKFVLSVIALIMWYIADLVVTILLLLVLLIVGGIGAGIIYLTSHAAGHGQAPIGAVLLVAGAIVLYGSLFVCMFWYQIGSVGYLLTLLDAYALYFLGGRYPLLGNLLEPGPGAPFTPPPVFPSSDECKDSDGGPPMPMNPAVA
jgi:hypothetical protein